MELTSALKHRAFDVNRPSTRSAETGQRTFINPPTHESQGAKKITLNDWLLHNQHLSTTGQNLRNDCIGSIQKSHATSDAVKLSTTREQTNTTNNLSTRLNHIERATDNLEVSNDLLDKEILALEQVKADTEQMLRDMGKPYEIAKQCLEVRQQRRCVDSVRDKPECELMKEVKLIEKICGNLQNKIQECFNQLNSLRHARAKIAEDLEDKSRANKIDTNCKTLTEAGQISFQYQYINSQNRSLGSNPSSWARFSDHNCQISAKNRTSSRNLREQAKTLQNACRCDLKAQNNAVDQALRVRINEMETAKNELAFNRRETNLEIEHAEREIASLKQAIQDQVRPMQIAQTRMAHRERRPNVELCHDHVEAGLKHQIHTLAVDTQNLHFQLERIHERRTELRQILSRIEDDLAAKMLALELDQQNLQLRSS